MPYRRTYRRKFGRKPYRKYGRRWKTRKFKKGYTAKGALTQNTVYRFTRIYKPPSIVSSTGPADAVFAEQFQLDQLPGYTEFAALYDQYKITGVKMTFIPRSSEATLTMNAGNILYVRDYDDSGTMTFSQVLEKQGAKLVRPIRVWSVWIPCRPSAEIFKSTVGAAYGTYNGWLDMAYPNVPHYGLKWVWTPTSTTITMDVYYKFYVKFRGVQ